ncbi:uncharacterized protein FOMMEDRAFT_165821 [Fomitiporia mediterranea MF3/22]|uniref:uncharacterized protein n=1 Tax=Fomitiporia mediterranea (strain MF3/22) TaxID=694068 RepID=UPI000440871D|nr:uncharacterized protein FOMMEDRAFT_165821 [Fomitiporia mediterranea MF3/22]EJD05376.1 hypothetical protein FOMMEDRAFT_165821 [Fomitiporia mediterranea MF3/22]
MPDVSAQSQWHTVRPWSPRFLLTVREITSVSTTFVLSSTCARDGVDASLASLGISSVPDSDDEEGEGTSVVATRLGMSKISLVSDALGRGLSVNVNGAAWKRVLMRMDEKGDEAVLVLYGLMPGRQYDVEIGILFGDGGEEVLHSRMVTQPQPGQPGFDDSANISTDSSSSAMTAASNIPSSSSSNSAITPHQRTITQDEYASQLRAQLSQLNAERDGLAGQLKAARKEAHKADAAKRNEIEMLKRAAEKHASAEFRGRQKTRALQEASKQAAASARDAEESACEIESSLPAIRALADEVAQKHANVKAEAARAQEEAEEALRSDRTRTEALRNELSALTGRLEKLQAKKAKLSGDTLPKLEDQLAKLIREVELVARDAGAFEVIDNGPVSFDLSAPSVGQQFPSSRPPGVIQQSSSSMAMVNSTPAAACRQNHSKLPSAPSNLSTNLSSNASSNLSSRALPFDPGQGFTSRLSPAFQFQPNSTRRIAPPNIASTSGSVSVAQQTRSSEIGTNSIGRSDDGAEGTNSGGTGGLGRRPR